MLDIRDSPGDSVQTFFEIAKQMNAYVLRKNQKKFLLVAEGIVPPGIIAGAKKIGMWVIQFLMVNRSIIFSAQCFHDIRKETRERLDYTFCMSGLTKENIKELGTDWSTYKKSTKDYAALVVSLHLANEDERGYILVHWWAFMPITLRYRAKLPERDPSSEVIAGKESDSDDDTKDKGDIKRGHIIYPSSSSE